MKTHNKQTILVLYNLTEETFVSADVNTDQDTKNAAESAAAVLRSQGFAVEIRGIYQSEINQINYSAYDSVFNLLEWTGTAAVGQIKLMKAWERSGIKFTGGTARGYALSVDKAGMKKLFLQNAIPSPEYRIVEEPDGIFGINLKYPLIVKTLWEHCAIGMTQDSVVTNADKLHRQIKSLLSDYQQPVLIEEYIDGREIHVSVMEKHGRALVLPPAEMVFKTEPGHWPIMTYEAKWQENSREYGMSKVELAKLDNKTRSEIYRISRKAYGLFGNRGLARLDFRINRRGAYLLEINVNPSIDYPGLIVSAKAAGLDFGKIVRMLVDAAEEKYAKYGINL